MNHEHLFPFHLFSLTPYINSERGFLAKNVKSCSKPGRHRSAVPRACLTSMLLVPICPDKQDSQPQDADALQSSVESNALLPTAQRKGNCTAFSELIVACYEVDTVH